VRRPQRSKSGINDGLLVLLILWLLISCYNAIMWVSIYTSQSPLLLRNLISTELSGLRPMIMARPSRAMLQHHIMVTGPTRLLAIQMDLSMTEPSTKPEFNFFNIHLTYRCASLGHCGQRGYDHHPSPAACQNAQLIRRIIRTVLNLRLEVVGGVSGLDVEHYDSPVSV
jgi:hypothetical protein